VIDCGCRTEQSQADLCRSSCQAERIHWHRPAEAARSNLVTWRGPQSLQQRTQTLA